jgi:apolipoprotein N-acyltransferase
LLLLTLSAAFLLFANGRNTVALAAWLAPVFLLRFVGRGGRWRVVAGYVVLAATWAFQFRGMVPAPQPLLTVVWVVYGAFGWLPYLAHRILARRITGFASTLVFPCAAMGFDYLVSLSPYASWGSPAYSQYGNLPLMQLASVTGIYGITFLIAWFASVVNWAWANHFEWARVRAGAMTFAVVLGAVLLWGGARLMFPPRGPTVRIASLTTPDRSRFPNEEIRHHFEAGTLNEMELQQIREWSRSIDDDLLRRAAREADAGARIVFWGEGNSYVLPQDEPWLMAQASDLALAKRIYLGLGNVVYHYGEPRPLENTLVLFNPQGKLVWKYLKAHPVPGAEAPIARPSDGQLRFEPSPYGRISAVVCFDADSVQLLHQAGKGRASLVLIPSNDWREIDPWHTQMAVFRGLEQGFNMVRHVSRGLSLATDYQGRVRGLMDHYQTYGERQLVAEVPTAGVRTVYSVVGDLFSWLALAVLGALAVTASRRDATWFSPQRTQRAQSKAGASVPVHRRVDGPVRSNVGRFEQGIASFVLLCAPLRPLR